MGIPSPISKSEIDLFRTPGLSHEKSEILCRMANFSYLKTKEEIQTEIGTEWPNLKVWLDEDIENQGFAVWNDEVVILSFRGSNITIGDWSNNADAFFPDPHTI